MKERRIRYQCRYSFFNHTDTGKQKVLLLFDDLNKKKSLQLLDSA